LTFPLFLKHIDPSSSRGSRQPPRDWVYVEVSICLTKYQYLTIQASTRLARPIAAHTVGGMSDALPALLTIDEVAIWLTLTARDIRKMVKTGAIPCIWLPDGTPRFEEKQLQEWLWRDAAQVRYVPLKQGVQRAEGVGT
jgi:hypothetical protein